MELKIVCKFCKGSKDLYGAGPCPFCEGRGNETVVAPDEGYYHSVDICDKIEYQEFVDLKNEEQRYLTTILGSGEVNLVSGGIERNKLRELFPAGTQTNSRISQMIGEAL